MQKTTFLNNLLLLSIIALLFSACSATNARRKKTLFNSPTDHVSDTIRHVYVVNDQGLGDLYYRIKVNDVLAVRNLQNQEFGMVGSTASSNASSSDKTAITYPVDNDGTVNLPAIGRVSVVGLTRKEVAAKLQQLYEKDQLKKPIIEVTIVNVKVTLLGEFSNQGNYLLERDNTSLIEIIGQAGGITKDADPKTLKIIRGDKSNPETIYVNLNDINSLGSKKLILQNNDIIVIQPTKNVVLSQKLQSFNNIVQPLLVIINVAVLVFTFTR